MNVGSDLLSQVLSCVGALPESYLLPPDWSGGGVGDGQMVGWTDVQINLSYLLFKSCLSKRPLRFSVILMVNQIVPIHY